MPIKTIWYDKHALAPVVWLVALYVATALTAGVDATPDGGVDLILFEARHIAMHLAAFAIQAWLIANALRLSGGPGTMHNGALLIALVLVLGVGQEALQGLYRQEVRVLASLWDLAVDTAGGAIGWWWYKLRQARLRSPTFTRVMRIEP